MGRQCHKAYELIAIAAGRQAGLELPELPRAAVLTDTARASLTALVADCPAAREIRDRLYEEFERRLGDPGYTVDLLWEWFCGEYTAISRSAIGRAREAYRAAASRIEQTAAEARAFVALAKEAGADAMFEGGVTRAGQLLFELLYKLKSEDLQAENPADLAKVIRAMGAMWKTGKEAALLDSRLAEVRKTARAAVDAEAAAGKRQYTREDVYRLIDDAMKGKAA